MIVRSRQFLAYFIRWYDTEQEAKDVGHKLSLKNVNTGRDKLHDVEQDGVRLFAVRV